MGVIDPYRMLGRFDYAVSFLMQKYNLGVSGEVNDWFSLFSALSSKVDEYDKIFCVRLAAASKILETETRLTNLNQIQADEERNLGIREAEFIFRAYPDNYANKLLEDKDYLQEIKAEEQQKKRENQRNVIIGLAIVSVIIAGIVLYNLPYFAEDRAFSRIEKLYDAGSKETLDMAVADYKEKYPEGRHFSEVMFMPVKYVRNSQDVIQVLDAVDKYLEENPKGPYVRECKEISDKIWDVEIQKYETIAQSSASQKGADFVKAMLQYMKRNNVRTIDVVAVPHLDLKEYKEYPYELRKLIESVPPNPVPGMNKGEEPKLPDDLVTIKDKITIEDAEYWVKYIVSALQKGFNNVLTPNFITFKEIHKENKSNNKLPKVTVNYTVSTQETIKGLPDIWVYSQSIGSYVYSAGLFLGIRMNFDATFSLPGESIQYNISGSGDAGSDDLNNISISVVYSKMCEISTYQFAEKIADEFGLKPQDSVN